MATTYDKKCHDLALAFLSDLALTDERRAFLAHELASELQDLIEDFIDMRGLSL